MTKPLIVFDGQEGRSGRALFCISSLYFAEPWLSTVGLRFIDVDNPDVSLALGVARWDLGIDIDERDGAASGDGRALLGARLYAGVAFGAPMKMRLAEAHLNGAAPVVMIQHPDRDWLSPSTVLYGKLAFDPARFARHLGAMIARLP